MATSSVVLAVFVYIIHLKGSVILYIIGYNIFLFSKCMIVLVSPFVRIGS